MVELPKLHENLMIMRFKTLIALFAGLLAGSASAEAQTISTFAGTGTYGFSGDSGLATAANLSYVARVATDIAGNVYFGDWSNERIRRVDALTGIITTVAGNGGSGFGGDGGPATDAQLQKPQGLTLDKYGNLYIADVYNNRVRKVDTSGMISTFAGGGTWGVTGDGGPATNASVEQPFGVAFDRAGNLYIAEMMGYRIRLVDTAGIIHTFAGAGMSGFSGDGGPAIAAELKSPIDVTTDSLGNVYISDLGANRIREVLSESGIIITIVGSDSTGYSGDGGAATAAKIHTPEGITIDNLGNLYFVDGANSVVRIITPDGNINTFAGNGFGGYSGDGGPATDAALTSYPNGVATDTAGNVYIGDNSNARVRAVTKYIPPTKVEELPAGMQVSLQPNPSSGHIGLTVGGTGKGVMTLTNVNGQTVGQFDFQAGNTASISLNLPTGMYFYKVVCNNKAATGKLDVIDK